MPLVTSHSVDAGAPVVYRKLTRVILVSTDLRSLPSIPLPPSVIFSSPLSPRCPYPLAPHTQCSAAQVRDGVGKHDGVRLDCESAKN